MSFEVQVGSGEHGVTSPQTPSWVALYLRVAKTLERSAELAEQHAERCRSNGQRQSAAIELERAQRARAAAQRGRAVASQLASCRHQGPGETAAKR